MEILTGIQKVYEGASEVLNGVNPLVTTMEKESNIAIATALLDAGFTEEQIQDFIDVSSIQFKEWVGFEIEIRKRMAAKAKPRTKTRAA